MNTDDNNSQVSDQLESAGLPSPTFSSDGASSPSANVDDALVSKLAEKLAPALEERIAKAVQSQKDKRFSTFEKALGKAGLLDELEEQGVQIPKDLRNEYRLREIESRLTQPQAQADPGRVSQAPTDAVSDALAQLKKHGLESNDPAFIEILRGQYPNKDAFDSKVKGYILDRKTAPPPPSPAGFTPPPATGGTGGQSVETMTTEYIQKFKAAPRGQAGNAERERLKEEFRQKGVDIYHVDFS